jgi:hypothetical protein
MRIGIAVVIALALCAAVWFAFFGGEAALPTDESARDEATEAQPDLSAPAVNDATAAGATDAATPVEREVAEEVPTAEPAIARFVKVRVVDAQSTSVRDARVRVRAARGAERNGNSAVFFTGDEGTVSIGEEPLHDSFGKFGDDAAFTFDFAYPLPTPVAETIAAREMFEREIVLTAPGCGAIEVEVHYGGRRIENNAEVMLTLSMEHPEFLSDAFFRDTLLSKSTTLGVARFNSVPPGLRLNVRVLHGERDVQASEPLSGPTYLGEVVRRTIDLANEVQVSFRVLDAAGLALSNSPLALELGMWEPDGSGGGIGTQATTDAEGRCAIDWSQKLRAGHHFTLTVRPRSDDPARTASLGVARLRIDEPFHPGHNDLGDLQLVPPPLLVAGTIVTRDGKPVADTKFTVVARNRDERSRPHFQSTASDAEGRFVCRADDPTGEILATVRAAGFVGPEPMAITSGATNLEFVLSRGATVIATCQLPADFDEASLSATLTARDAPGRVRITNSDSSLEAKRTDRELRFERVPSGTYDFALHVGAVSSVVAIPNIVIEMGDGETVLDPRLQDLELTHELKSITVTVLGRDGSAIADACGVMQRSPARSNRADWVEGKLDAGGALRFTVGASAATILIGAEGFRPALRENVDADLMVRLDPELDVTIRARGTDAVVAGNRSLGVRLIAIGGVAASVPKAVTQATRFVRASWARNLSAENHPFAHGRDAQFRTPWPGRFRVDWAISETNGNSMTTNYVEGAQEIELHDTASPQAIEVDLPPGLLGG